MRSKEVEQDYRFMADPDLPRFNISDERISQVKRDLRATPFERKKNFSSEHRLEIMEV